MTDRFNSIAEDEPLDPPPRINSRVPSGANSPRRELPAFEFAARPGANIRSASTTGFEGPTTRTRADSRGDSPAGLPRLTRVPTEPSSILGARSNLRMTKSRETQSPSDVFGDDQSDYSDHTTSAFSDRRRTPSWSTTAHDGTGGTAKKAPPPPPPSRVKKPPPPPPMKRSALSTSEVPQY